MTRAAGPIPSGTAVVLLGPGGAIPGAALPVVRSASAVYTTADAPATLADEARTSPVVLLTAELDDPNAVVLLALGAEVVRPEPVYGGRLLEAVAVMDRLRSPGGCPWDAEQTHDSLRQYLVEECYELLEAIEDGDRAALREELGDVLLQVLFHSRVAQEASDEPFSIDDVAGELVAKLVGRHPHVFGGGDPEVRDARSQENRWEQLKQQEKKRESSVDGVAMGQPAAALVAKLVQRTRRVGLPVDLLPDSPLFAAAAMAKLSGDDPEDSLRAEARRFAEAVRVAEQAARSEGVDPAGMDESDWRRFWPR
ncbi:MazG family protein [Actinophytocola oryzae]|uniref:XTP/dITP diphosphohydrolase n=1 Tax=Actinophytocola oryzae TaxID=502181 RepID=A0A4R7V954_9PSEU|nr:MazG family protein [Actinophytocola oryzae]TDV45448.1 XTP/dITP diphosphohydrolase [Actinophytocola oryzae]